MAVPSFARHQRQHLLAALNSRSINRQDEADVQSPRMQHLRAALSSLQNNAGNDLTSVDSLVALLHNTRAQLAREPRLRSSQQSLDDISFEWLFYANIAIEVYMAVLQCLLDQAGVLQRDIEYWTDVETSAMARNGFLLQTSPSRLLEAARAIHHKLVIARSDWRSLDVPRSFDWHTAHNALHPSLLVSAMFPYLATRHSSGAPLSFLSYSPVFLARQEARKKRKDLEQHLASISHRLGFLASKIQHPGLLESLENGTHEELVEEMDQMVIALRHSLASPFPSSADTIPTSSRIMLQRPSDIGATLLQSLSEDYHSYSQAFVNSSSALRRPSRAVRLWPRFILVPICGFALAKTLYNAKREIQDLFHSGMETITGFVYGWLLEPAAHMLKTIRHGEDDTLALMGRQSLNSDLNSLERMVADFGKDVYSYSSAEMLDVGRKVKEGDLSDVMRVWEKEIKSPLKFAVTGSLVRVLLIQIQKVKVDVDLAMSGVEKMLRSQSLTFGFISVAPSILILYGAMRGLRALFSVSDSRGATKHQRRQLWTTLRSLDTMLLEASDAQADEVKVLGTLLLKTHQLRTLAFLNPVLRRDKLIGGQFLGAVQDIEGQASMGNKREVLKGVWTSFGNVLKITQIV